MNKILGIEGISGSGKTTVVNYLKNKNYYELIELSAKYPPQTHFPKFTTNTDEAIIANDWFIQKEIERCTEARNVSLNSNVVADRWYFSLCAFSYARSKVFGTKDYSDLNSKINHHLSTNDLFIPEIIILDVPVDLAINRLNLRYNFDKKTMNSLNMTQELLHFQREYFLRLSQTNQFKLVDGTKNINIIINELI